MATFSYEFVNIDGFKVTLSTNREAFQLHRESGRGEVWLLDMTRDELQSLHDMTGSMLERSERLNSTGGEMKEETT